MNTLFVLLVWTFGYYLFFHRLNEVEDGMKIIDQIYRNHAEGYDETV